MSQTAAENEECDDDEQAPDLITIDELSERLVELLAFRLMRGTTVTVPDSTLSYRTVEISDIPNEEYSLVSERIRKILKQEGATKGGRHRNPPRGVETQDYQFAGFVIRIPVGSYGLGKRGTLKLEVHDPYQDVDT